MNTVAQNQSTSPSTARDASSVVASASTHLGTLRCIVRAFNEELKSLSSLPPGELCRLMDEIEKGLELAERDITKVWWGQGPRLPACYGETERLLREELSGLRTCVKRAVALARPEKRAQAIGLRKAADAHFSEANLHLDDLLTDGEDEDGVVEAIGDAE